MATPSLYMDHLKIQDFTEYNGLIVFPLALVSSDFDKEAPMEVIGAGPHDENIHIVETGHKRSVRVVNRGNLPALLLDGTILMGGAADRMLTESAVVRKDEVVNLPSVSIEAKRWDCRTTTTGKTQITAMDPTFTKSSFAPSTLRRLRLEKSMKTMKREGVSRVNQNLVISHIKNMFRKSSLERTENFNVGELYEHWDSLMGEYASRFAYMENQIGHIVFLDRNTWYLDVFFNSDVCEKLYPNLIKSYTLEAILRRMKSIDREKNLWAPKMWDARRAMTNMKLIKFSPLAATGKKGEEIDFFSSKKACGTALTDGGRLMHMAVCSRYIARESVFRSNTRNIFPRQSDIRSEDVHFPQNNSNLNI